MLSFAASLLLAGCASAQTGMPTAATVASRMQAAADSLNSYTADIAGQTMVNGKPQTINGVEWVQKPDLFRARITDNGHTVLTVLDGKTIYTYNQATGQLWEIPLPSAGAPRGNRAPAPHPRGSSGMMETPLLTGLVQRVLQDYDVTLAGQGSVSGRPAYILDLQPKPGATGPAASGMQMWVDARLWLPVKMASATKNSEFSWVFSNLRVNPVIPSTQFQFQAPKGAKLQTISSRLRVTLSEAQAPSSSSPLNGVIASGDSSFSGPAILTAQP